MTLEREWKGIMSANYFDLRQAEELLPELESLLSAAVDCKKLLDEAAREQAKMIERVVRMGGSRVNLDEAVALKRRKEQQLSSLREQVEAVQDYGVLIKDLDMGLLDFPTLIDGREAYLCWKLGEPGIRHWHYTDEGFANRKVLDGKTVQVRRRPL
jgi:hypothetical protein